MSYQFNSFLSQWLLSYLLSSPSSSNNNRRLGRAPSVFAQTIGLIFYVSVTISKYQTFLAVFANLIVFLNSDEILNVNLTGTMPSPAVIFLNTSTSTPTSTKLIVHKRDLDHYLNDLEGRQGDTFNHGILQRYLLYLISTKPSNIYDWKKEKVHLEKLIKLTASSPKSTISSSSTSVKLPTSVFVKSKQIQLKHTTVASPKNNSKLDAIIEKFILENDPKLSRILEGTNFASLAKEEEKPIFTGGGGVNGKKLFKHDKNKLLKNVSKKFQQLPLVTKKNGAVTSLISSSKNETSSTQEPPKSEEEIDAEIAEVRRIEIIIKIISYFFLGTIIFSNILVIVAYSRYHRLKSITNRFVISLAIADLCVGLSRSIQELLEYIDPSSDSKKPNAYRCLFFGNFPTTMNVASLLNLLGVTIDRYISVTDPLRYNSIMTEKLANTIIVHAWGIAFLIIFIVPHFFYIKPDRKFCTYTYLYKYILTTYFIMYVIILFTISLFYGKIFYECHKHVLRNIFSKDFSKRVSKPPLSTATSASKGAKALIQPDKEMEILQDAAHTCQSDATNQCNDGHLPIKGQTSVYLNGPLVTRASTYVTTAEERIPGSCGLDGTGPANTNVTTANNIITTSTNPDLPQNNEEFKMPFLSYNKFFLPQPNIYQVNATESSSPLLKSLTEEEDSDAVDNLEESCTALGQSPQLKYACNTNTSTTITTTSTMSGEPIYVSNTEHLKILNNSLENVWLPRGGEDLTTSPTPLNSTSSFSTTTIPIANSINETPSNGQPIVKLHGIMKKRHSTKSQEAALFVPGNSNLHENERLKKISTGSNYSQTSNVFEAKNPSRNVSINENSTYRTFNVDDTSDISNEKGTQDTLKLTEKVAGEDLLNKNDYYEEDKGSPKSRGRRNTRKKNKSSDRTEESSGLLRRESAGVMIASKTTIMIAMIVGTFAMLGLPLQVAEYILIFHKDIIHNGTLFYAIHGLCVLLYYSNSAVNPYIYAWKNRDFRESFKQILTCSPKRSLRGYSLPGGSPLPSISPDSAYTRVSRMFSSVLSFKNKRHPTIGSSTSSINNKYKSISNQDVML